MTNQPTNTAKYIGAFTLKNGISGEISIWAKNDDEAWQTICNAISSLGILVKFDVVKETSTLKVLVEMPRLVKLPNCEYQVAYLDSQSNAIITRQYPHKETAERFLEYKKKECQQ